MEFGILNGMSGCILIERQYSITGLHLASTWVEACCVVQTFGLSPEFLISLAALDSFPPGEAF